jgi:opacity protein-like surface antigen
MLLQSFLKICFAFLFASLIFVSTCFSQSKSYLDSLDGKFALQFQIEGLFRLTSFQGSTLSGKYNFSDRDVVRLGISLGITDSDIDNSINEIDTTRVYYEYGEANRLDVRINTQYIRHISVMNDISFFAGGGPFVSFFSSDEATKVIRYGEEIDRKRTLDRFSFGLEFILGVEWMFYDNMTLSAEYGINADYSKSDAKEVEGETIQESTSKSYNLNYNRIKFGLSVYF